MLTTDFKLSKQPQMSEVSATRSGQTFCIFYLGNIFLRPVGTCQSVSLSVYYFKYLWLIGESGALGVPVDSVGVDEGFRAHR